MQIVATDNFQAIELVDLSAVTGGYDFTQAVQAGNAAAGPGREAGQTLGNGFDAGYRVFTGTESTVGSRVGGPLGAAVGWTGGFVGNSVQQLWSGKRWPGAPPAARSRPARGRAEPRRRRKRRREDAAERGAGGTGRRPWRRCRGARTVGACVRCGSTSSPGQRPFASTPLPSRRSAPGRC